MIVIIDIGSHKCQEFKALFHTNPLLFGLKLILLKIIGVDVPKINEFFKIINIQKELKKYRKNFYYVLTEPNHNLFNNKLYQMADAAFCIAIGNSKEKVDFGKLYFHSKDFDLMEQGSSIYNLKKGKVSKNYLQVLISHPNHYFENLKLDFDNRFDGTPYKVILRINCEGSESDVIRSCREVFREDFNTVLGSLDDVKKFHGESSHQSLIEYLDKNKITFIPFNTLYTNHLNALKFVLGSLDEKVAK